MSVRVRFAPSPTGYLHIGGARTALYNYHYAKAMSGKLILRIEDTDQERSKKEFEDLQVADLKWLGIEFDESPENPGKHGPYRQSERMDIYQKYAKVFLDNGLAFYDFCTDEELIQMKEFHEKEGTPAYTGKWKNNEHWAEAKTRIQSGETAPIRFLVPNKEYKLKDHVRGQVTFPAGMVGDFVILRSNGFPTFNFCNVVDDHLQEISHVIRGEDHLNNTLRQIMLYEALGVDAPEFAHLSLLIGEDRQKLSKRHGATSTKLYKDDSYLPQALCNYLTLLGWSHPDEKNIFTNKDLNNCFNLERFSKSPAIYDIKKLAWTNGEHLKSLSEKELYEHGENFITNEFYQTQADDWKNKFLSVYTEKVSLITEMNQAIEDLFVSETINQDDQVKDVLSWESTPALLEYLKNELEAVDSEFLKARNFKG